MRQTGALPDWLIVVAIRKRRSESNGLTLFAVTVARLIMGSGKERRTVLCHRYATGGLPSAMSQLAKSASWLTATADPAVAASLVLLI
ncbi:hypothetical protein ABZ756_07530 [Mammaliicoccus sciuri]|uniref:Uncharacterized protein n=1 Tax=Sporosarcina newyorkensis 2681 TaxID=1027292 RepID=F9DPZ3_9BACL|nr:MULTISPECIES: hypothetical protein [Sporosarcina]EGQ27186.1 hypothetical protein HMPREF9372_0873 [Sporosarcina newyorkensis 2681]MBY0221726.1 hypothetical protein [Sporosarcina aquimarina]